jgi:hypothetical protein
MKRSLLLLILATLGLAAPGRADVQDGDIIFQSSQSGQSQAIQLATHSPYSHVGIVFKEQGHLVVYEAVQPVKRTPMGQWILRGKDQAYVLMRLKDRSLMTPAAKLRLKQAVQAHLGKDYDWSFGWSDEKLYCSELVWKAYDRALKLHLAELKHLRDFDLSSDAVQSQLKKRYGDEIPLDEPVISPADLLQSPLLVTVVKGRL